MIKITLMATAALAATFVLAGPAYASSKNESFSLISVSTNANDVTYSAVASGEFNVGGTAVSEGKEMKLSLSSGTITLARTKGSETRTPTQGCIQKEVRSGTYVIVGGTGAYKGISGSGQVSGSATFVEPNVAGKCSSTFSATQTIFTFSGPTLP